AGRYSPIGIAAAGPTTSTLSSTERQQPVTASPGRKHGEPTPQTPPAPSRKPAPPPPEDTIRPNLIRYARRNAPDTTRPSRNSMPLATTGPPRGPASNPSEVPCGHTSRTRPTPAAPVPEPPTRRRRGRTGCWQQN